MTMRANTTDAIDAPAGAGWQRTLFKLGLAGLRVGYGLVFLTNGIAKLGDQPERIAPFKGFLITRDGARGILDSDTQGHPVGIYRDFIENVVLAHWEPWGAVLAASEIAIGICLILGLVTPIAALAGAGFQLHLNFANIHHEDKWLWEAAVEWLPLLALACTRAGRFWGLDGYLARRFPQWPIT